MTMIETGATASTRPVVFAYDGSELAGFAIEQAALEIVTERDALVLCVWQPANVCFQPIANRHFDADVANEVRIAAEETAAYGASLAEKAGFRAQSLAVEAAPTWKGIVDTAEEHHASLIVLGPHRKSGLVGHLLGSVSTSVVTHATSSVLVVYQGS